VAMKRSSPTMIALYVALVFLSGALVGGFGHRLYSAKEVSAKAPAHRSPEAWRQKYIGDMTTRLKLEKGQVDKLVQILDDSGSRFKAVRDRMDPEMKQIQLDQRDKIRGMLTADQKTEYEKILAERAKREQEREKSKGQSAPPPPPGGGC